MELSRMLNRTHLGPVAEALPPCRARRHRAELSVMEPGELLNGRASFSDTRGGKRQIGMFVPPSLVEGEPARGE